MSKNPNNWMAMQPITADSWTNLQRKLEAEVTELSELVYLKKDVYGSWTAVTRPLSAEEKSKRPYNKKKQAIDTAPVGSNDPEGDDDENDNPEGHTGDDKIPAE